MKAISIRFAFAFLAALLFQGKTWAQSPLEQSMAWVEMVAGPMAGFGAYAGYRNIFLGYESRSNERVCFHCPNDQYVGLRSVQFGRMLIQDRMRFGASLGVGQYKVSDWAFDSTLQIEKKVYDTQLVLPLEGDFAFGWEYLKIGLKGSLLLHPKGVLPSGGIFLAMGVQGFSASRKP